MTFKNITYTLSAFFLLAACNSNDVDEVFSETADERVKKAIEEYRSALLDAPNGWKAMILPGVGGGYFYYFEFHEDGTVTMVSDFDEGTAGTSMAGTYVMKGLQRPTLSFDTYSYIHLLADPDGSVNGGASGEGLYSDFEFALTEIEGDTLKVEGIQRNTEMIMVQATAQERSEYLAGLVERSIQDAVAFQEDSPYTFFNLGGGNLLSIGFNLNTKVFTAFYVDASSTIQKITIPFIYSPNGLLLKETFSYAGLSFQEVLWDDTAEAYYIMNGSTKIFIQGAEDPVQFTNVTPSLINALGLQYRTIDIYGNIGGMSPEFTDLFNNASDQLETDFGVYLDHISISFDVNGDAVMVYFLTDPYYGSYIYDVTYGPGSTLTFGIHTPSDNIGINIEDSITPLLNYFKDNTFTVAYVPDANLGALLAGMYPEDNNFFCYGILE